MILTLNTRDNVRWKKYIYMMHSCIQTSCFSKIEVIYAQTFLFYKTWHDQNGLKYHSMVSLNSRTIDWACAWWKINDFDELWLLSLFNGSESSTKWPLQRWQMNEGRFYWPLKLVGVNHGPNDQQCRMVARWTAGWLFLNLKAYL
jgi:hypothetical protein